MTTAVWTVTGKPMLVGKAVLDPTVPTLFAGEVPDEVKFQAVNLRMEEVSGPNAPSLGVVGWRHEKGETHGAPATEGEPGAESIETYDAVVSERDTLRGQLTATQGDLTAAQASVSTASRERDQARDQLVTARRDLTGETAAKETAEVSVATLTGERDQAHADLAAAIADRQEIETLLGTVSHDRDNAQEDLAKANAAIAELNEELGKPSERETALQGAIDAVLSASATSLGRLPNDALARLCALKGVSPIPDTTDGLVAALKPAA